MEYRFFSAGSASMETIGSILYNHHLMGPASFPAFVAWDRPYSAWIYMLTTAVFGRSGSAIPYFTAAGTLVVRIFILEDFNTCLAFRKTV
jgi:hypothetical protein